MEGAVRKDYWLLPSFCSFYFIDDSTLAATQCKEQPSKESLHKMGYRAIYNVLTLILKPTQRIWKQVLSLVVRRDVFDAIFNDLQLRFRSGCLQNGLKLHCESHAAINF